MALKPYDGDVIPDAEGPDPSKLKPYEGEVIGDTPDATVGDVVKEVGASAIESVGSIAQMGGELISQGVNALTGEETIRAVNPLGPVSEYIRESMTPGGQAARRDTFKGDILDPSSWTLPETGSGAAMGVAQGVGSLAATVGPLGAAKVAGAGSKALAATGAVAGGAMTGGSAAESTRQSVRKTLAETPHEQLLTSVPAYREAIEGGMQPDAAKEKIESRAALYSGLISAAAGAAGGAVNAKFLDDILARKGIALLLGKVSEKGAVRAAAGGAAGAVGEGAQEVLEQVGQNVGENVGLGREALEGATRDTFGPAVLGAAVGGPVGAAGGALSPATARAAPGAAAPPPGIDPLTGEIIAPPPVDLLDAPASSPDQFTIMPDPTPREEEGIRRMERQTMLDLGRARGAENLDADALTEIRAELNQVRAENQLPPVPVQEWKAIVEGMLALETPTEQKPAFPFLTSQAADRYAQQMTKKMGQPFTVSPHPTVQGRFAVHPEGQAPVAPRTEPSKAKNAFKKAPPTPDAVTPPAGRAAETGGAAPIVDRRTDTGRRARVADMSPEELRREILTSSKAGIGNDRAYKEAPKRAVQASLDLDSLKWVNDTMGHEAGDQLIAKLGEALRDANIEGYHVSGDEFVAQFDDDASGQSALDGVRNRLANAEIEVELPDGSTITKKGIGFSYGLGKDLANAEVGLQSEKSARERSGQRASRGAEPSGVSRRAPQGQQDQGGAPAAEVAPEPDSKVTPKSEDDLEQLFDQAAAEVKESQKGQTDEEYEAQRAASKVAEDKAVAEVDAKHPGFAARYREVRKVNGGLTWAEAKQWTLKLMRDDADEARAADKKAGYSEAAIEGRAKARAAQSDAQGRRPNENGAYAPTEQLTLANPRKDWKGVPDARIDLAELADGRWTFGANFNTSISGAGFAPAIDTKKFATREEAIAAGIAFLRKHLPKKNARPEETKTLARINKWLEGLESDLGGTPPAGGGAIDEAAHEAATSPQNDKDYPTVAEQDAGNYAKGHDAIAGMPLSIENPEGSWRYKYDVKRIEKLREVVSSLNPENVTDRKSASNASQWLRRALDALDEGDPVKAVERMEEAERNLRGQWHVMADTIDSIIERGFHVKMPYHYGYFLETVAPDKGHVDVAIKPGTTRDYKGPVYVVAQNKADGTYDEPKVFLGWHSQDEARAAYTSGFDDPAKARIRGVRTFSLEGFKKWVYDPALTKKSPIGQTKPSEPPKEPPKESPKPAPKAKAPTTGSLFDDAGEPTPEATAAKPPSIEDRRAAALKYLREALSRYVEGDRDVDELFRGSQGASGGDGRYEFRGNKVEVQPRGEEAKITFSRKQIEEAWAEWVAEAKRDGLWESTADRHARENREAAETFKPGDTVGVNAIMVPLADDEKQQSPYVSGEPFKVLEISPEKAILEVRPFMLRDKPPIRVAVQPRELNQWYGDPYGTREPPAPESGPAPGAEVTLEEPLEGGGTAKFTMPADQALKSIDDRIAGVEGLLACLD